MKPCPWIKRGLPLERSPSETMCSASSLLRLAEAVEPQGWVPCHGCALKSERLPAPGPSCWRRSWSAGTARKRARTGSRRRGSSHIPPRTSRSVENSWNTVGFNGSGSNDVKVRDAFVPRHRAGPSQSPGKSRTSMRKGFEGPLYRCTVWSVNSALWSIALGVARAAIDESSPWRSPRKKQLAGVHLCRRCASGPISLNFRRLGKRRKLGSACLGRTCTDGIREVLDNVVAGAVC